MSPDRYFTESYNFEQKYPLEIIRLNLLFLTTVKTEKPPHFAVRAQMKRTVQFSN